ALWWKVHTSTKKDVCWRESEYMDKIDADLFNVDELHWYVQYLGYDPEQLMFYRYKLPNKGLDYGLKPISCDADVISLIKLVANCKVIEVFVEYWLTSVDHHYVSPFKSTIEIEKLDDDVLNAPLVRNSKMLALCWINEADVAETSVEKNANVNVVGESSVNVVGESSMGKNDNVPADLYVNDYTIDDRFAFDIDENLNLKDYTVYVNQDKNTNENVNVVENVDENMNENVNADDEYDSDENEQDNIEDEEDLTDEALEVLDFDSSDSDVGDDTASIRRMQLRKLRKTEALKKANPNTTVKIDVYRAHNPQENVRRYKILYVCLGALKEGFRASGRQLLGLNVAFMKQNYPGQLLTALSVDANNEIYAVAYDIVESESKESWTWFLSCLGDDFDLEANSNFTFIIDRQKGLLPALKDLFPATKYRYCVRHIHDNINLIYKGSQYKKLLWKCATATTEAHFERAMDEFKGYNRLAHEWLRKTQLIVNIILNLCLPTTIVANKNDASS
nr:hypothetical protein [Tanacetum cinerariifolium]